MSLEMVKVQRWVPDHAATGRDARRTRERAGVTLRETARRMKVSPSYLCDLEKGKRYWTPKNIDKFNRALAS